MIKNNLKKLNNVTIKLFILPILLLSLGLNAQTIPDDINVDKYKKIYLVAKQHSDQKRAIANDLNRQIDQVVGEIRDLNSSIRDYQNRISRNEQNISYKYQEISRLQRENSSMEDDIESNLSTIRSNNHRITQLNQEIRQVEEKLVELRQRRQRVRQRKQKVAQELAQANQKLQNLQQRMNALTTKAQNLTNKIKQKRQEVKALNQKIQKLRTQKQNLNAKKNQHKQKIQQLRNSNDPQKEQKIAALRQKIQNINQRITNIDSKIANARTQKSQKEQKIAGLVSERQQVNTKIAALKPKVQQARQARNEKQQKLNQVNQRLQNIAAKIKERKDQKNRLSNNIARLNNRNQSLRHENRRLENQIDSNHQQIRIARSTIQDLQEDNRQYENRIADLEDRVKTKELQEASLRREYASADRVATNAEAVTQSKYAKYIEVKNQYDREYLAAQREGASQGQPLGHDAGNEPGQINGTSAGLAEGNNFGTEEGLLSGYLDGLIDGQAKGKADGYKHGRELPDNYNRGYQQGYAQGIENAKAIARRENYFPSRAKRKKELLSVTLSKTVNLDNGTARGRLRALSMNGELSNSEVLRNLSSPSSGNMIPLESLTGDSWGDLEALILKVSNRIEEIPEEAIINENTGVVTFPIPVDKDLASCRQRYVDFVEACFASFVGSYKAAFKSHYKETFRQAKRIAFADEKPKAFAKVRTQRIEEGNNYAYPIAYAAWDAIGSEEAANEGRAQGLIDGEANTIDQARREATAQGIKDEENFFNTNPVIRLKSVDFAKVKDGRNTEVIAGDEILLKVKVANFGKVKSSKGQAKIKWEAITKNVIVDETLHPLVSIPGETNANVSSVAYAKVDPMAVLSELVQLRVTMYQPDGEVESKVVSFKTKQHLNTFISLNADSEVERWGGNQFILVKISNKSPVNSPKDLKVKLTVPSGRGVKATRDSHNFGKIKAGVTESRMFNYEVRKARVGDVIPVTITVYFGGQVSAQKVHRVKITREGSSCGPLDPDCF